MKHLLYLTILILFISCSNGTPSNEEQKEVAKTNIPKQETISEVKDTVLMKINSKIREDINNVDLYLERASYYEDLGFLKEALLDIDRAYRIDTSYLPTLLKQADILSKNGKLDMSLSILSKADAYYPENSKVYVQLSKLYLIAQNNLESLKNADLAIKYDLYNAEAYYLKGYNFLEVGDTTKAISSYQTAIEQDPEFFDAYLELGLIYSEKDDPLAIEYYNNALEVIPNERRALYSKGLYEQEHELLNEALATYTQAIKAHPDFREAHFNMGYIHLFYLGLYRDSQKYFTDAIEVDPRYLEAYYNRGYSFELLGDITNAGRDYRKALSIDPTYDAAAKGLSRLN